MGDSGLKDAALQDLPTTESFKRMRHLVNGRGWKWEVLDSLLPHQVLNRIAPVLVSYDNDSNDGFNWGITSEGLFTVKSAYTIVVGNPTPPVNGLWTTIWKLKVLAIMCSWVPLSILKYMYNLL